NFLTHLQYGRVKEHHIEMLSKLVLGHPVCPKTDFENRPWKDALLVTLRHGVCKWGNEVAIKNYCRD
ncbi:hypothetical protein NEOLEDRAFT_1077146, partial [Neolentinus lepideus HHB14362 ss-1]